MTNVVNFGGYTRLDIDPDSVLEGAKGKLSKVLVIGCEEDDLYMATSTTSKPEILYLIEQLKFKLLNGDLI